MTYEDPWSPGEEEPAEEWGSPSWRGRVIRVVTVVALLAMLMLPFYSLIDSVNRPRAENGLEICDFDYCVVQEAVREAGLGTEMTRLASIVLSDDEAARLVQVIVAHLDVPPVRFEVVDDLGGRTAGLYEPATRTIRVERPIRAWTIAHEAAHMLASAHGTAFTRALIEIVTWLEATPSAA
ncbi:MAG: hypothetical protein WBZ40_01755 [Acidimicrobiia bacterium]